MGDSESSVPSPSSSDNSKGSFVSTGLREEYKDLLRYAVELLILMDEFTMWSKLRPHLPHY